MKYNDHGFRPLYKNFCIFPVTGMIRAMIKDQQGAANADGVLVYGYIDHEAGLSLEILALTRKQKEGFAFGNIAEDIRMTVRIGSVIDEEFDFVGYTDDDIKENFKKKIEMLDGYNVNDEVEESRKFGFLDEFRSPEYPDDVMVLLLKEGLRAEGCWVRIEGLQDGCIVGKLLNELNQNFGYHRGEIVAFFVHEFEDGTKKLFSDMNPSQKLKAEDLEDGSMLRDAIVKYNEERTQENFIDVLEILRDSDVWVPCNAILSDEDQASIEQIVKNAGDDLESLKETTFSNSDNIRFKPDILQNGEEFFFPVFSSIEEMGEYGDHFSKISQPMLNVIGMAKADNEGRELKGIVINAFSTPMVIPADLFEVIENMKSRICD